MTKIQPLPRLSGQEVFIRVYELPNDLTKGFCFPPKPIEFLNVDWFRVPVEMPRNRVEEFLRNRTYWNSNASYLILGDSNDFTWVIGADKSVFNPLSHEQTK